MISSERRDLCVGLVLLVGALFLCFLVIPFFVQQDSTSVMSPRFFPYFSAAVLGLLSALLIISTLISSRRRAAEEEHALPTEKSTATTQRPWYMWRTWLAVAALCAYFVCFDYFDFLVVTPFATAALMLIFGEKKILSYLIIAPGITIVLYLLFEVVLKVPLD